MFRLGSTYKILLMLALTGLLVGSRSAAASSFAVLLSVPANVSGSGAENLVFGHDGALYGSYSSSGATASTVFKLTPPAVAGGAWTYSVVFAFPNIAGQTSVCCLTSLAMDKSGKLFGTSFAAGAFDGGTVFKLTPPTSGQGQWTETTLFGGFNNSNGTEPFSKIYVDSGDAVYGTTFQGGPLTHNQQKGGVIYRLSPSGSGAPPWVYSVLSYFDAGGYTAAPDSLFKGQDGSLYGLTRYAGTQGEGSLWRLTPPVAGQHDWTRQTIFDFTAPGPGGTDPVTVLADRSVTLFGTAAGNGSSSGTLGFGTVYRLSPPPLGLTQWTETVLHTFAGGADGSSPNGLVESPTGELYGTTVSGGSSSNAAGYGNGTVFKLTSRDPGGHILPWDKVTLHHFNGSDGQYPTKLIRGSLPDGTFALFGITNLGGMNHEGVVFEVIP